MGPSAGKLKTALGLASPLEKRVLLVGPNAAGKTTLLYGLKLGFDSKLTTMPTIGFNVETITRKLESLTVWDLGLRSKMRPLVRHYCHSTDALIFMVDATDREFFWDAEELFEYTRRGLQEHDRDTVPCLVFANKSDHPSAMSLQEISDRLSLPEAAKTCPVHVQPCDAKTGEGVEAGLDFLARAKGVGLWFGAPSPTDAPAAPEPLSTVEGASLADENFLRALEPGARPRLKSMGPEEIMRLVLLSGEDTLETLAAVRSGYDVHATRMHFWATRAQAARAKWRALKVPQDSRRFLEALLPATEEEREALLRAVYSDKIDDPTWAISVMPPDRRTPEADEDWLERIQQLESYGGELDSFCALLRLAFILLKAFERREAIKRMDVLLHRLEPDYAFHETRQYVALQLAHLALAQVPALKEAPFQQLEQRCPELCQEDCIYKYYSRSVLAAGSASFVVPDVAPLPSVVSVPEATWHEQLDDDSFLEAVQRKALSSWGLPSLARLSYLLLRQGRREGLRQLLQEVETLRKSEASAGLFAHETLAYFTIHMTHFFIASNGWSVSEPFPDFAKKCDKILDAWLYRTYYSDRVIHSTEARSRMVLPDLCPLPNLLAT